MERLESRIRSGMYQVAKFAATWSCGDARNIATVSFVLDHPVEMPSQQKVFRIKHNTWSLWSSTKRHSSSKTRNWCGGAVTVESGLPQFPVEAPGTGKEKCKTICDARSGGKGCPTARWAISFGGEAASHDLEIGIVPGVVDGCLPTL